MASQEEVSGFIGATFRSVWALELLCLLRQNRERSLSRAEMVAGLRGSDLVISQSVESLSAAGLVLVEPDGATRFSPASAQMERLAEQAEALYRKSPNAVRRTIISAGHPGIAAFADAFRLRKE